MPSSLSRRVEILEEKMVTLDVLREEMRAEFSTVRKEFVVVHEKIDRLSTEMRVLHEDVVSRIALLQEARGKRDEGDGPASL